MAEQETEFVERYSPIDDIESTFYERIRAREYANIEPDGEYTYSTTRLEALGRKWMAEEDNPLRSERSRREARYISDSVALELACRTGEVRKLEEALTWEEK